VTFI